MSTSWSKEDGTPSKFCSEGGSGGGPDSFTPNCFAGGQFFDDDGGAGASVYPQIAIGTNDFAFEFWKKTTIYSAAPGEDFDTITGLFDTNLFATYSDHIAHVQRHGASNPHINFDWGTGSALIRPVGIVVPGWHHNAINVDRSGTMTWYIDGEVYGSVSVAGSNGVDLGSLYVAPLYIDAGPASDPSLASDPGSAYPDSLTDEFTDFSFTHFSYIIGPFAVHVGALLSTAQILNSFRNRVAQNIAGTTQAYYNWRRLRDVTGWEANRRHIYRSISDFNYSVRAPETDQDAITVVDESDNGNELQLDAEDFYGPDSWGSAPWSFPAGTRATCGFNSDPFFGSGGGKRGQGI